MIQSIEETLNSKIELAKKLDECQEVIRETIRLATKCSTADNLVNLSAAVKIIDKAWEVNNEQIEEIKSVNISKQIYSVFPQEGMG